METIFNSECTFLARSLFVTAELPHRILEAVASPTIAQSNGLELRKENLGVVTKVGNLIQRLVVSHDEFRDVLDTNDQWAEYVASDLAEQNRLEEMCIGGGKPSPMDFFSSDPFGYSQPADSQLSGESHSGAMSLDELSTPSSDQDTSKSSTTGKIVERSLKANKRLLDMDDSLATPVAAPPLKPETNGQNLYKANEVLGNQRDEELIGYNANNFWRDNSFESIELEDL